MPQPRDDMPMPKEFIEVTAIYDGRKAAIRAVLIEGVTDNAEQRDGERIIRACRTIYYAGRGLSVTESYDEIMEMIYNAEL